jgi:hypothetical protein
MPPGKKKTSEEQPTEKQPTPRGKKRAREADRGEETRETKRRAMVRGEGVVRILSVNTFGFDDQKWAKLEEMADDHGIDLVLIQESTNAAAVEEAIQDSIGWEPRTKQEGPWAKTFDKKPITPQLTQARFYTLVQRTETGITVEARLIPPMDQCPGVCRLLGQEPQLSSPPQLSSGRRSSRLSTPQKKN